jgi:hypothetical protein
MSEGMGLECSSMVECLPSMCKAQILIPSTIKNRLNCLKTKNVKDPKEKTQTISA